MRISVFGVNGFNPGKSIDEYAQKRLTKVVKLLGEDNITDINVVCKVYKEVQKVEITVILSKNNIIRSEVSDQDIYAAIDLSIDKLIRQINKHKEKLQTHLKRQGVQIDIKHQNVDIKQLETEVLASQLIKNKKIKLEPMSLDEAVLQMEMLDHSFFIFINEEDNKHTIVYKREDGNYAVIVTE